MSIVYKIKAFFYDSAIKSVIKKSKNCPREMKNFDSVKTIGIIFNATKTNDVITVTEFADNLRRENKEVTILGFQDRKLKEETDSRLFDKSKVNWYGIPSDEKVVTFNQLSLDVLICAFEEECLPLEYVAATSKAKFRVGAFGKTKTNYYELMINIKEKQQLNYLLKQMLHFLKVINKNA